MVDVINGLAITASDSTLYKYYADNVIGGPNSFVVGVSNFSDFGNGVSNKLQQEIAPTIPPSTEIPFEFSPSLGILILGAWAGIEMLKTKKQKRKVLEVGSLKTNDRQPESV